MGDGAGDDDGDGDGESTTSALAISVRSIFCVSDMHYRVKNYHHHTWIYDTVHA